eukprot:6212917-Pleurochrysis_carterae.AAC.2
MSTTSTSAPRALSSASKVDGSRPSPEKAMRARQAAGAPSSCSGSATSGPTVSPAWGGAATKLPSCRLRVAWVGSAPAQTRAAAVPPPSGWSPPCAHSGEPAHAKAGGAAGCRAGDPPGPLAPRGGGSGGGGGGCDCAPTSGLWAADGPAGAAVPALRASSGALGARDAPSPVPYAFSWARRAGTHAALTRASAPLGRGLPLSPLASRSQDGHALGPFVHSPNSSDQAHEYCRR